MFRIQTGICRFGEDGGESLAMGCGSSLVNCRKFATMMPEIFRKRAINGVFAIVGVKRKPKRANKELKSA